MIILGKVTQLVINNCQHKVDNKKISELMEILEYSSYLNREIGCSLLAIRKLSIIPNNETDPTGYKHMKLTYIHMKTVSHLIYFTFTTRDNI